MISRTKCAKFNQLPKNKGRTNIYKMGFMSSYLTVLYLVVTIILQGIDDSKISIINLYLQVNRLCIGTTIVHILLSELNQNKKY